MHFDLSFLKDLAAIFALVLINGIFVAAEFAMIRINPVHFSNADGRRKFGSRTALRLVEEMELSLSSLQFGITVSSILLGWFGVQILAEAILEGVDSLGFSNYVYTQPAAIAISLTIIIVLHVVIGELAAKSLAVRRPELVLRVLSGLVFIFIQTCRPIIFVLNRMADLFLRLLFVNRRSQVSRAQSLAELSFLVSKSTEGGLLDADEEQMLRGVFGLSDTVAREVMTPRTDLVVINSDAPFDEVLATIRESGLSRFPVAGESIDDVHGILLARDVLSFVVPSLVHGALKREDFSVRKLMREAYFVPGTKPIDDLLAEFKRRKLHLAIVLDEHGGVDGVVTLEDLIEEIVGDIFDESDIPERSIIVQDNGDVLIDGGQLVADLNSRFSLEIPEGDYDTIAGFIFTSLGRMPRPGDSILINRSQASTNGKESADESEPVDAADSEAASATAVAPDAEEAGPKALITVEKVQSYRIETVRLRPHLDLEKPESDTSLASSNSQEPASEQ